MIRGLNEEIERASGLVSASAAKESAARDQIETLFAQKETLGKERDQLQSNVDVLSRMAAAQQDKVAGMEDQKLASEHELNVVKAKLTDKGAETDRELARKEQLDAELKELRAKLEENKEDFKLKQARAQAEAESVKRVDELTKAAENQEK